MENTNHTFAYESSLICKIGVSLFVFLADKCLKNNLVLNLHSMKWSEMAIKLPAVSFSAIVTDDERYAYIVGGENAQNAQNKVW